MGSFSINLSNFQSIADASLVFEEGVNVILGQSNSGKTAILRGLDSLITNPTKAKRFIKHHTEGTAVNVQYNGNDINWARGNSASSYEINGESYSKVGRTNLFGLIDDSGFVQDEKGKVMNIEGEWDLPFPFDRTPSELFKLFENVFCVSDSAVILKAYNDEEKEMKAKKSGHEEAQKRYNAKIKALDELAKEVDLVKVKSDLKSFEDSYNQYIEMVDDYDNILSCREYQNFKLDEVVAPTTSSLDAYVECESTLKFVNDVAHRIKFYKSLPEPLVIGDTIERYETVKADYDVVLQAKKVASLDLSVCCDITGDILDRYQEVQDDYEYLLEAKQYVDIELPEDFECSDVLERYTETFKDYEEIVTCLKNCKDRKKEYLALDDKIAELNKKLSEYKVCPLCGQELKGEAHVE